MEATDETEAVIRGRGRSMTMSRVHRCQREMQSLVSEPGLASDPFVDQICDFEDVVETQKAEFVVKPGQFEDSSTDAPQITVSGPPPEPLFSGQVISELRKVLYEGYGLASKIGQEVRSDRVRNQKFILVNTCSYGPGNGSGRSLFVPGEVALTAFTLENGVIEQYHSFVDPGRGTRGQINNADETLIDRWPKGLRPKDFDAKYQDVDRILTEMETFIEKHKNSDGDLPKLVCFNTDWVDVLGCFNWLYLWRKSDDNGASYNQEVANPPIIWLFGHLAHQLLFKISKELYDQEKLTLRKTCKLDWKVLHLTGFHSDDFFELLPNREKVIPRVDENLKHRMQHDRGFTGHMFLQRRNFYNAVHAEEYFKHGVMLLPKELCCEYHREEAPSTMHCTKALGALAVRDLMDCLKYVKGHYV